jgi:hypothetical protein
MPTYAYLCLPMPTSKVRRSHVNSFSMHFVCIENAVCTIMAVCAPRRGGMGGGGTGENGYLGAIL